MAIITKIEENKAVIGKKKVAAYCRVSTDQDDQLLSLETQKAHYESWIQGHSDWEYAGLYYDEGLSGTKMDTRPSLLRMMEDCKHGLIDYVVTKSVSRLARNTADFLTIVRTLLDLGIPIYFEKENIDTGSMENELMLSIMSSIAESESVSISENNKWSIQRKFKNGTYKCSYPPYGYDWDKKNGEMVVNPEQAEIVRYIFAQTLAGVGTHDIAKDLMAKGVPTKKGGKWTGHTVNGIIRNEKYTGDCLFQKTYTDSYFVRRRNLGELDQYYVERMERRNASTVASMPFQASAPAKSAETFIEESHGTTGARNTRYGDAAQEWNTVPTNVMHLRFRKQIFKQQL